MSRPNLNLQDHFLNQVRRENLDITIIMLDGAELVGRVKGFDNFTVIVQGATGGEHLIYKHAIAQLVASKQIVSAAPPRAPRAAGGDRPSGGGERGGERPAGRAPAGRGRGGSAEDESTDGRSPGSEPSGKKAGFNKLDLSGLHDE
jgi:host factor-I protein